MRGVVIQVDHLGKTYPVYDSPVDALKEVFTGRRRHTDFRALDDVSFRVREGERVGVVGANGAGKSTLLKILAGTVGHSSGRFRVNGRMKAILELGTGFHEESTGRENIVMGGLCLGYSREELEERADWIIAFSELGPVIDRPLRTYSSGMKMRLMYAVAFCKQVEVMIIDEALATGDGAFVRKCTNHIVELCGGGTTALIVSHNLYFLERICHRVIYLRDGRIVANGDPLWVCKLYERDLGRRFVEAGPDLGYLRGDEGGEGPCGAEAEPVIPCGEDEAFAADEPFGGPSEALAPRASTNGTGEIQGPDGTWELFDFTGAPAVRDRGLVRLVGCKLYDPLGQATEEVVTGQPCRMRFVIESRVRKADVHLGFMIWNEQGEHVATTTNICSLDGQGRPSGRRYDLREGILRADVVFPSLRLGAGRYTLRFGVAAGPEHFSEDDLLLSEDRCLAFSVLRHDHVQTVAYEPHSAWEPLVDLESPEPSPATREGGQEVAAEGPAT